MGQILCYIPGILKCMSLRYCEDRNMGGTRVLGEQLMSGIKGCTWLRGLGFRFAGGKCNLVIWMGRGM